MRSAATLAQAPEVGTMHRFGKAKSVRPPHHGLIFTDGISPRSAGLAVFAE